CTVLYGRGVKRFTSRPLIKEKAEKFAKIIQEHWKIENKLHWVKDAIFREDQRGIKDKKAQEKISIITSIIINF
ncbi:MAG: transposase, partial [Cyanobacterium sp. T60_A2020_053]|nr:transposase [Cyanobacterium sp. T60_A2020_053]